jgi:hypothetical protein
LAQIAFSSGMPSTAVYFVLPRVDRGHGGLLDVVGRVEIGFARAEADHVAALAFSSFTRERMSARKAMSVLLGYCCVRSGRRVLSAPLAANAQALQGMRKRANR